MEQKSGGTIKRFLLGWLINTLAVLAADFFLPGIHAERFQDAVFAALLLGLLNAFVRPLLMLVTIQLVVLTLGLFMLVINAVLLLLVAQVVNGFEVRSFGSAFLGAIIISIVSLVLNLMSGITKPGIHVRRFTPPQRPPSRGDDGGGPVIDV